MRSKIDKIFSSINLIAIIVGINLAAYLFLGQKIDLTNNRVHSLDKSTIDTIRNLDDIVKIKVYRSKDLPSNVSVIAADLKSILEEYQRINKTKLVLEYVSNSADEEFKTEAIQAGIQPLQFSAIKDDKLEVSNGFLGLTIAYGNKTEVMPVARDVGNIEYYLTSTIKKMTQGRDKSIGLVKSSESVELFSQALRDNFKVTEKPMEQISQFGDDIDSLVLIGINKKIDEKGISKIKDLAQKGKGIVIFDDSARIENTLMAAKNPHTGLEEWLESTGIKINDDLVADPSSAIANFRTKNGTFLTQYPFWMIVRPENIANNLPMTSGINNLMMPWTASMTLSGEAKPLVKSSEKAISYGDFGDVSPNNKLNFNNDEKSNRIVAAINTSTNKVAVFGTSQMINDQFTQSNPANLILGLNTLDYLSGDSSMLNIRSKNIATSPIKNYTYLQKQTIKAINIALPIIILLVFSLIQIWMRKRRNLKLSLLN